MTTTSRVWCNFTVKTKNGDVKLRIQDMPSDRLDDVANLFAEYFASGETFHKIAEVTKSKEAKEECKEFVKEMMEDSNVSICCIDEDSVSDSPTIIAAGIMSLTKKSDPVEDFNINTKTKEMARVFELMFPMFEMFDAMKELDLDMLYDDRGLVVHPDYCKLGIAQKMFNVRRLICKEEGVPITGAMMTGFGSQKAATRDGWETVFEISYEEISKILDVTFEDVPQTLKYMVARI